MQIDLAINGRFLAQPTTGVQRVAREITREIDAILAAGQSDLNVRLICQPEAKLDDLGLKAIKVDRVGGLAGHAWEQTSLPLAAGKSILLCLGNSAPIYSLLSPAPVAIVIHDLSYRLYPEAYRPAYRFGHSLLMPLLLRKADLIVTVSQSERLQLEGVSAEGNAPIIVAQNGGWRSSAESPEDAGAIQGLEPGYLLYVGSLSQRKNLQGLFDSAVRLAREDGLSFVFVGSTAQIHTETALSIPADVRDKIIFVGHVEETVALARYYRGARCLIFPSFYEASPLPPLEAMHFGCPVVASRIPSLEERCGDAAEYCDPESVDDIVAAARRVVHNDARSAELIALGHERAALYSWRAQAETILKAIKNIRPNRPG